MKTGLQPFLRALSALASACALAALMMVGSSCGGGKGSGPSVAGGAPPEAESVPNVVLLYPDESGEELTATEAFLPLHGDLQRDMADLLKRYVQGPPGDDQILQYAEGTAVRAVFYLGEGRVVVDLSGPARSGGGVSTEAARVYGLVNTLAINYPAVATVQLLVEGQEVESLLGHLDLSRGLPPNPKFLSAKAASLWRDKRGG